MYILCVKDGNDIIKITRFYCSRYEIKQKIKAILNNHNEYYNKKYNITDCSVIDESNQEKLKQIKTMVKRERRYNKTETGFLTK